MPTSVTPRRAAPKKPLRRRDELVEAAVRIFAARGYESASTQEIGEQLGLLKGSIYYYIDSKEDLLFSVVQSVHEEMARNLERAKLRNGAVEERLRSFFEDLLRLTLDRIDYSTVFHRELRHLSDERQAVAAKRRGEYEQFFLGLVREGQAKGVVRDDIDAKLLAKTTLTLATTSYTWYRNGASYSPGEVVEAYSRIAMSGLGCAPPSPAKRATRAKTAKTAKTAKVR